MNACKHVNAGGECTRMEKAEKAIEDLWGAVNTIRNWVITAMATVITGMGTVIISHIKIG